MSDDAIAWTAVGITTAVVIVVIILLLLALRMRRRRPAERGRRIATAPGKELRISPHHADEVLGGVVADHAAREQAVARATALRTARQSYEQSYSVGAGAQQSAPAAPHAPGIGATAAVPATPAAGTAAPVFTDSDGATSGQPVSEIGAGRAFEPEWMTQPGQAEADAPRQAHNQHDGRSAETGHR